MRLGRWCASLCPGLWCVCSILGGKPLRELQKETLTLLVDTKRCNMQHGGTCWLCCLPRLAAAVPCAAPRGGAERGAHPKPAWPWAHKRSLHFYCRCCCHWIPQMGSPLIIVVTVQVALKQDRHVELYEGLWVEGCSNAHPMSAVLLCAHGCGSHPCSHLCH